MFSKNYKSNFKIASHGRVLLVVSLMCASLHALPTGGVVASGTANIAKDGSTTNINQQTNKASINWQSFSISPNEAVNFNQPNQNSLTLNRVIGNEKSVIEGALNANGKVFLINSNGVLFTKGSSVNTAGLVASTLNIKDEDFNSDNFVFKADKNSKNSVINLGTITTTDEGYVALLGESVINDGVIIANRGTVSLNSADKITLNFNGNSLINVSLDEGTLNSLVESNNAIIADGGLVILTAKAANELISSKVNVKGAIKAQTIGDLKGEININAYEGKANIDADLEASFIETSGDKVKISDSTKIKADKWLIDPTDFTIGEDITGAALSANLENTDIEIQSAKGTKEGKGDINVNDKVEWNADTTLTLTAQNDININNAIISHGNEAGVELNYGGDYNILTPASFSGTVLNEKGLPVAKTDTSGGVYGSITFWGDNAKLIINGDEYTLIYSLEQLDALDGYDALTKTGAATNVEGKYALAHDIDAGDITYQSSLIGLYISRSITMFFNGIFAGLGHIIDNLKINSTTRNAGLFSNTMQGSVIRDLGLTNIDIESNQLYTGALVGNGSADISNVYVTGNIKSTAANVGGLIGLSGGTSTISDSFTDMSVTALYNSGGLVGQGQADITILNSHTLGDITSMGAGSGTSGSAGGLIGLKVGDGTLTIRYSYATGNIISTSGEGNIGGLLGREMSGNTVINNAFATGNILGNGGGLVGEMYGGTISNVYATGDISNGGGGLIGTMYAGGTISNAFATGNVNNGGGGLIGNINTGQLINQYGAVVIENVYATGDVTGSTAGALIGTGYSTTVTNAYATGSVNGESGGALVGSGGVNIASGGVLNSEEFAYIDQLMSGDMTLDEVKTDIINVKEAEAERIRQEELAEQERQRQEAERLAAEQERQRLGALALNDTESIKTTFEKAKKAKEIGFGFSLIPSNIIVSNVKPKEYDTDVNAVTVENTAYSAEGGR
ncbi:MAG: filamentous hemagglutinin N-terminal domain-containing protein [Campylobacteraceae bacterium]|jgi:filamentous hemagglutinin family protein|nr:filamentous hemagglutinin N-terminal domain-containing protein [Campylobacteraceae bacterium]